MALLVAADRAAAFGVAARWVLHDLRSPAQSLTLMADLLDQPAEDLEETFRHACGHLARSLDLLSRLLHPAPPGAIGPISVREPIDFIADLQRAARTPMHLEVAVDPALPPAAGIQHHLEHALLDLVLHASAGLRPGESGAIRITARRDEDQVEIAVAHDGPRVPPEDPGRIFEIPPGAEPADQPLGASLPVAREVLRLSGGSLTYAPGPENGAGYLIRLPVWRRTPAPPGGSAGFP